MHHTIPTYVLLVSFGMFWLIPPIALLAEPTDVQDKTLELGPLVQEAMQNNPEIAATREQVQAMKERAPQVGTLADPELKVQLWNTPDSLNVTKTQTVIYGVSQQFPFPGLLSKKAEVATREAEQAGQRLAAKEREITAAVKIKSGLWSTGGRSLTPPSSAGMIPKPTSRSVTNTPIDRSLDVSST
jgi:hypothetical protein